MNICSDCYSEAEWAQWDDGFYYDYGSITNAWHSEMVEGSTCCEAKVLEGKVVVDRVSKHVARKDHMDGDRVVVRKGSKYEYTYRKGYVVEDDGGHKGFVVVEKRVLIPYYMVNMEKAGTELLKSGAELIDKLARAKQDTLNCGRGVM